MRTEHRARRIPIVLVWTTLLLFGCAPRTAAPRVTDGRLHEETPKSMPGVEVEVLAAQRAGRGDAYVFFLLGRHGQAEKAATLGFGSIDLVAPPEDSTDSVATKAAPVSLSESDANAVRATIEGAILAATTPELFDPPPALARTNGRPWRRVDPSVRLRVDPAWLASEADRFDGGWVMLASPGPPSADRVVVNVVGWRYSMRRSRPLEIALSRGTLPENWVELPWQEGGSVQELIEAVRVQKLEEALPEGEPVPWRAILSGLRIEVDRAWLDGGAPLDFERWVIVKRQPQS